MFDLLAAAPVWPVDTVPDRTVLAPHHFWTGLLLVYFAIWHIADDYVHREPSSAMAGVLVGVIGFLAWEWHPILGAVLSHAGLLVILYAVAVGDYLTEYRWFGHRGVVLLGLLIAADDAVEHAWGIWTPLDSLVWAEWIIPVLHWARRTLAG